MRILNIGSMNLDYVYSVDHIVLPGETQDTGSRGVFLGGKGLNQSIALARAGAQVWHCGLIGTDGQIFLDACRENGVHTDYIGQVDAPSGHAIIQVTRHAQNSILLFGGANRMLTENFVDEALSHFERGDVLLLQNEVNLLPYIVDRAWEKGLQIALNPSPFHEGLRTVNMEKIAVFLLNKVEGWQLSGESAPDAIVDCLRLRYPQARVVLTLGAEGVLYADSRQRCRQTAFPVEAVDTTAAGDTFTGYFLAGLAESMDIQDILRMSAKAAAIAVTRSGAVPSIPWRKEVT